MNWKIFHGLLSSGSQASASSLGSCPLDVRFTGTSSRCPYKSSETLDDEVQLDLHDETEFLYEALGRCGEATRFAAALLEHELNLTSAQEQLRDDLRNQAATQKASLCGSPAVPGGSARAVSTCRLLSVHRARLVHWMREVSDALQLQPSTTFIAVSLLDRFTQATAEERQPPEGLLQLLTLTCMSVAVKYNEVAQVAPSVWLDLSVDSNGLLLYKPQDLQRMEFLLLHTLGWRLHVPTVHTFLAHYLSCIAVDATADPAGNQAPDRCRCRPVAGNGSSHLWTSSEALSSDSDSGSPVVSGVAEGVRGGSCTVDKNLTAGDDGVAAGKEAPHPPLPGGPAVSRVPLNSTRSVYYRNSRQGDRSHISAGGMEPSNPCGAVCGSGSGDASGEEDCGVQPRRYATTRRAFTHLTCQVLVLAGFSLVYDFFAAHEPSTVALACLALADRLVGLPPSNAPGTTSAIAAVCAATGLPLDQLAPQLEPCQEAMEGCLRAVGMLPEVTPCMTIK